MMKSLEFLAFTTQHSDWLVSLQWAMLRVGIDVTELLTSHSIVHWNFLELILINEDMNLQGKRIVAEVECEPFIYFCTFTLDVEIWVWSPTLRPLPSKGDSHIRTAIGKAKVTFALRRGYGGRTPSELTETCGCRSVSEVASGWPYVVWLYFTGRRGTVEL